MIECEEDRELGVIVGMLREAERSGPHRNTPESQRLSGNYRFLSLVAILSSLSGRTISEVGPISKRRAVGLGAHSMKLWDPHQGLWNWALFRALHRHLPTPAYKIAARVIIAADTGALAWRALEHRIGVRTRVGIPQGIRLYYFDLGTHGGAGELTHMLTQVLPRLDLSWTAFGFEASSQLIEEARERLAGHPATLVHAAVCFRTTSDGTVRLYTTRGGLGNSLYRLEYNDFEVVPAIQFSKWLRGHEIELERNIVLVRMNIEGAEREVINDLRDAGLLSSVDGWFGMWDDLSKIDPAADAEFRAELAAHGIESVTFNGRDLNHPLRMRIIDAEILTAVRRGVRRIRGEA